MFKIALFLVHYIFLNNISCLPKSEIDNDISKVQEVFDVINEENAPKALIDLISAEKEDK